MEEAMTILIEVPSNRLTREQWESILEKVEDALGEDLHCDITWDMWDE